MLATLPTTVAIWKPKGPTSHDVVDFVQRITGERRVGHAGTLDPMAEGVLVIGIGREATRKLKEVVEQEKEYVATVRLGATSTTDDAEGEITPTPSLRGAKGARSLAPLGTGSAIPNPEIAALPPVARDDIEKVLRTFIGCIEQVPPAYSAVKLGGTPAYELARHGRAPTLKPRPVEIKTIELLRYECLAPQSPPGVGGVGAELKLRVVCGPGTYIRALARDIGAALGIGGYLTTLTRTRVGSHTKVNAFTLKEFEQHWRDGTR